MVIIGYPLMNGRTFESQRSFPTVMSFDAGQTQNVLPRKWMPEPADVASSLAAMDWCGGQRSSVEAK